MPQEYSFETKDEAMELFVFDGHSLESVSKLTGVSIQTLKNWSIKYGWVEQRKEHRRSLSEIRRNTLLLRKDLLSKAIQSLDPQDVYAVSRLEAATKKAKAAGSPVPDPTIESREINSPEEAIEALQEAVETKLNLMLTQPGEVTLSAIKDMKKALELVEQMKAEFSVMPEETKNKGLDEDQARFWREKVLGVK